MVDVQKPVVVLLVAQHPHTEEQITVDVERLDKALDGSPDVRDMLYLPQRDFLAVVDGLYRVAMLVHSYACQEGRMGGNCGFNGRLEPVLIQTAVECIEVRNIVIRFAWMLGALHVKAVLRFFQRGRSLHNQL